MPGGVPLTSTTCEVYFMSASSVVLAQIGCGYWGPNLLRNFSALPDCHVKYVVEPSPDRRTFVERNYPRSQPLDAPEIALNDSRVDAVIIATPAATHYDLTRRSLTAGKHAFVEKPLAMSVAEVDDLIELASKRGLRLMVGHTFLYNTAVEYLKQMVDAGDLGQIFYVYAQRLNLGVIRSDVNAMWTLAPHDISIIGYVLGQWPIAVSARGSDYIQQGIEDIVFMNMNFTGKLQASIQVSWLDPNKIRRLTFVGSRKMVVYDDLADARIAVYDKGFDKYTQDRPFDEAPVKLLHRSGDVWLPRVEFVEPIKREAIHFLDCIRSGAEPRSGPQNARDVVAVLEAADLSLKNGSRYVEIPQHSYELC
jgi:predicted dehydrogenase